MGSLLVQASRAFGTRWPFLSFAAASTRSAPSVFVSVTLAGATSMRATACKTVTEAFAWNDPETAVTTAEPFFRAVTRPSPVTVATSVFPLVHVTAASAIARSFPSRTDASSCTVAPIASSSASAGDILMPATCGVPVGLSLPHDGRIMINRTTGTARNLMARIPLRNASRMMIERTMGTRRNDRYFRRSPGRGTGPAGLIPCRTGRSRRTDTVSNRQAPDPQTEGVAGQPQRYSGGSKTKPWKKRLRSGDNPFRKSLSYRHCSAHASIHGCSYP